MSNKNIEISTEVLLNENLTSRAKVLYGILKALGQDANSKTYFELGQMIGKSHMTVLTAMKLLEKEGFIQIDRVGRNNQYTLLK